MRIFSRYMALKFLGPFLFGLGTFALLVFLGDLFDKLNRIVTSHAPAYVIAEYLALQIPAWAVRVVPMATLLAVLFSVNGFVRSGEFVAVQSSGVPARDFFRPLLWMSLAVAAAAFLAQETALPACRGRAQQLWRDRVHPEWEWDQYRDVVLTVGPERVVSASVFWVKDGILERPVLDDYGPGGLVRQLDAASARWDAAAGKWVFEKGVERRFDAAGAVAGETPFARLESDLMDPPRGLRPQEKQADEMSIREMLAIFRRLERLGQPTRQARTDLQAKIAYPFTNLILCALGIPIALRLRRCGKPVAFAAALVVGFFYLCLMELGSTLGANGWLPPVMAAWSANVVFGALGFWMMRKLEV